MKIIQVIFSLFLLFGTIDGLETAGKLLCPRCLSTSDGDACAGGTDTTVYTEADKCTACVTVQISSTILSRGCYTGTITAALQNKLGHKVTIGTSKTITLMCLYKSATDANVALAAFNIEVGKNTITDFAAAAADLKYDVPLIECYSCNSLAGEKCTAADITATKVKFVKKCSVCVTVGKDIARGCYNQLSNMDVTKMYKKDPKYYEFCTTNKCNNKAADNLFSTAATNAAISFPTGLKVENIEVPAATAATTTTTTAAATTTTTAGGTGTGGKTTVEKGKGNSTDSTDGGSGTKVKSSGNSMGLGLFTMVVATLVNL